MGQRLGQHFLINEEKLQNVADALEIRKGDFVIEIGPGHGELTQYLLDAGAHVTALERDKPFIDPLNEQFEKEDFEVLQGNALELLPMLVEELKQAKKPYMIGGNIPYYITGYLLRVIEGLDHKPTRVVLTIQKEVAERICAMPPRMNLLAASVQFWAKASITDIIPKKDFNPPPKVDSATIRLDVQTTDENSEDYFAFVKKLFAQPRKTIANNIAGKEEGKGDIVERLHAIGIAPDQRPQTLTIEKIKEMVKLF